MFFLPFLPSNCKKASIPLRPRFDFKNVEHVGGGGGGGELVSKVPFPTVIYTPLMPDLACECQADSRVSHSFIHSGGKVPRELDFHTMLLERAI